MSLSATCKESETHEATPSITVTRRNLRLNVRERVLEQVNRVIAQENGV